MARSEAWYRDKKKKLNNYHRFRFFMPRKGKSFTPTQRSAITRLWARYGDAIANVNAGKWTFIRKRPGVGLGKIPRVEKTNLGIFYNAPGASVVKRKRGEKPKLRISFKKIKEIYIPFPTKILGDMNEIGKFVSEQTKKFKPDYIMWAVNGFRGSRYRPDTFNTYASNLMLGDTVYGKQFSKDMRKAKLGGKNFLTGVYFGWQPRR